MAVGRNILFREHQPVQLHLICPGSDRAAEDIPTAAGDIVLTDIEVITVQIDLNGNLSALGVIFDKPLAGDDDCGPVIDHRMGYRLAAADNKASECMDNFGDAAGAVKSKGPAVLLIPPQADQLRGKLAGPYQGYLHVGV